MKRPAEFAYDHNIRRPSFVWARRICRLIFGCDATLRDEDVATFASMYFDADPVAERFVKEVFDVQGAQAGRELLERALQEGIDSIPKPPKSLRELLEDVTTPPAWVDLSSVERGAKVFRRYGVDVFRFAGAVTMGAYTENSVAKPLMLTGAYTGAGTKHRFLETAAFWIAVSEPNGLTHGQPGRASALRVRVMHVFVRRRLLEHPEWDESAWGVPISQADALLTLLGGSVYPALGLRVLGYRTSRQEIYDLMHFWKYVGHLMGVRPRFHPESITEAYQLLGCYFAKKVNASGEDGLHLCQSYVKAFSPAVFSVRGHASHLMHMGMTRLFLPGSLYRYFELPWALPLVALPLAKTPVRWVAETIRRRSNRVDRLLDTRARRRRKEWVEGHLGERRVEYKPKTNFTR